jgi:hypothetical protein
MFLSHLSPVGFLLLLLSAVYIRRTTKFSVIALALFIIFFWTYFIIFLRNNPRYQYYYARYLVSELVPYSLLMISLYAGDLFMQGTCKKYLSALAIFFISAYFIYFSLYQLKGRENAGAYESLKMVAHHVGKNDLLISDVQNIELITPLRYYFGLNVFCVNKLHDIPNSLLRFMYNSYKNVLVLSTMPLIGNGSLNLIQGIHYRVGQFEKTISIPRQFFYVTSEMLLFTVNKREYNSKIIDPLWTPATNFYDDRVWTKGDAVLYGLSLPIQPGDRLLVLNTRGWHPYSSDSNKFRIQVFANGDVLKFQRVHNKSFYFLLPLNMTIINTIRILSSTFIPKELGINNDIRELGIDVDYITIE